MQMNDLKITRHESEILVDREALMGFGQPEEPTELEYVLKDFPLIDLGEQHLGNLDQFDDHGSITFGEEK